MDCRNAALIAVVISAFSASGCAAQGGQGATNMWTLARQNEGLFRFSTLFTAQNVRDHLSTEEGLGQAIDWCKATAVTHVYLESFRNNYTADRAVLERARDAFRREGFLVSGCVTTTQVGKTSTGWRIIDCYTNEPTRARLAEIFAYAASMFDEIMIDDFLFTDCECKDECEPARGDRSWADYRCDLMLDVSRHFILEPARRANPNVKVIIKYPQWYDNFHVRGYDVARETEAFDKIWVGTETRDYADRRWGGTVQYEAYFIMRWLGAIGGDKCGGGWFDPYGTTEATYVEQARQTILADAKEAVLFCYGSLQDGTGPANVRTFRTEVPGYFDLARLVRGQPLTGVHTCKPPSSDPGPEARVFDFVGMLGIPLDPRPGIDTTARSAFFSVHALKDPDLKRKLSTMVSDGAQVLLTSNLADALGKDLDRTRPNVHVIDIKYKSAAEGQRGPLDWDAFMAMPQADLDRLRDAMLAPLGATFRAPAKVALYLIGRSAVVENFNDEPIDASLTMAHMRGARGVLTLPVDASVKCDVEENTATLRLPPRSLLAIALGP